MKLILCTKFNSQSFYILLIITRVLGLTQERLSHGTNKIIRYIGGEGKSWKIARINGMLAVKYN